MEDAAIVPYRCRKYLYQRIDSALLDDSDIFTIELTNVVRVMPSHPDLKVVVFGYQLQEPFHKLFAF